MKRKREEEGGMEIGWKGRDRVRSREEIKRRRKGDMDSRESAFLYAISSAGVTHALIRSCGRGEITHCPCGPVKRGISYDSRGQYSWGGCSHVATGLRYSRLFIEAADERRKDARALISFHNNRAGRKFEVNHSPNKGWCMRYLSSNGHEYYVFLAVCRCNNAKVIRVIVPPQAVQRKSRLQCKCHGVSGSCASRTCWKVQTDFGEVGRLLKKRYEGAVQVTVDNQNNLMPLEGRKPFSKLDLVYFEHSPDYCTPNKSVGTLGTGGRRCVKDSMGSEGCDILCCGRGYDTRRELFVEKCGCKFDWCCKVQCKVCREMKDVYTCKMQYKT
ncbi:protein Wnt-2b [Trichonephila clavata]|uniref:Protein Wnt n=1 Tax=Trichonephila clavata TaxID=2740835 RepID=A0A8X6KVM4_TRICU|nr:protein Wnt-2b [Trichonephila clavata]